MTVPLGTRQFVYLRCHHMTLDAHAAQPRPGDAVRIQPRVPAVDQREHAAKHPFDPAQGKQPALKNKIMDIHALSPSRFSHTLLWAVVVCLAIVGAAAFLGRATLNIKAALTDKPDIAIYLLLPEEQIGKTTLLRDLNTERDYLAETKDGPKLIKLKKGEKEWFVLSMEKLRE